jgi:4-hydroxybenzoate polyprenyltransferase
VAMITGAVAFAAKAEVTNALWMTLAAWCLAVAGFSLDFYADRGMDAEGARAEMRHSPLTDGSLSPLVGLAFPITFIAISFATTLLVAP